LFRAWQGSQQGGFAEVAYGTVRDHGDGHYTGSLRPIKKGPYVLSVTIGGENVAVGP
jgi:hypothetical protein